MDISPLTRLRLKWASVGAGAGAVLSLSLLLLAGGCYPRAQLGPAQRAPLPSALVLPVPSEVYAARDSVTEAAIHDVLFHLDDDIRLGIRDLRGRMRDLRGEGIVVLDDKESLLLEITRAEVALTQEDLTLLLNRYVFGYPGAPLRNLVVSTEGDQIVQTGVLHKIIDIPFTMTASLSVTEEGWIRIHPDEMGICGLDGKSLLSAVGASLEDILDLSGATGVRVEENDLLLDPLEILPPPKISGRLTAIRVEGHEVVQVFGAPGSPEPAPLALPATAENYVYFWGGTIRFGKLYMVHSDLLTIDTDLEDPFDFYLDYYHSQLVAGYHVTSPDYGLVTYLPDFDDLDSAKGHPSPATGPS
jgi:hypothetical protein